MTSDIASLNNVLVPCLDTQRSSALRPQTRFPPGRAKFATFLTSQREKAAAMTQPSPPVMPHRKIRTWFPESSHKYNAFVPLMQGVFETIFRFFTKIILISSRLFHVRTNQKTAVSRNWKPRFSFYSTPVSPPAHCASGMYAIGKNIAGSIFPSHQSPL